MRNRDRRAQRKIEKWQQRLRRENHERRYGADRS
jgi:hypothetical protein